MKTIAHRSGVLHVETPLGIVNISVELSDRLGRRVESVEVIAPCYSGEPKIIRSGFANTRLIECKNVRS